MEDISRKDRSLLIQALIRPGRLIPFIIIEVILFSLMRASHAGNLGIGVILLGVGAVFAYQAIQEAKAKQFYYERYRHQWQSAQDRLKRLLDAISTVRKDRPSELAALPGTVQNVADSVYEALRRADMIHVEILKSEGKNQQDPRFSLANPHSDAHVKELYQMADRNRAEYRTRMNALQQGIFRCEAQTAVFITALDTLRVKILGYRLMGKNPEIDHKAFIDAIADAKQQLESVDAALGELSYERLLAMAELDNLPPPIPDERVQREQER